MIGFIVDKFSLWAKSASDPVPKGFGLIFDNAGLTMMAISLIVLLASTVRFLVTSRKLHSEKEYAWRHNFSDLLLGLSMMGVAMVGIILMLHVAGD